MKRWIVVILIVTFLAEILSGIFDQNFWLCLFDVLVIAYFAINIIGGAQEELNPKVNADAESFFHWPSLGNFDFEVVGESNYQPALRSAAGDHRDKSPSGQYIAKLIPENDNQFDKLAVRTPQNTLPANY